MDQLEDWVGGVEPHLGHLEDFLLPEDFPFDYSLASLDRLATLVIQRYGHRLELFDEDQQGFVEGVVAYVGEALLRVAGGCWGWTSASERGIAEQPVVHPDQRLGAPAVSPLLLLLETVDGAGGVGVFARAHAALRERVDARRAEDPTWAPVKQPTPGLDRVGPELPDHVVVWLADRERDFPTWVAACGQGGATFDFSPESLDAYEAVVRRLVPTKEQLYDPANTAFVDGAVWYLGEVLRGAKGGQWSYRPGPPDSMGPNIGRPFIQQPTDRGSTTAPILDLSFMLSRGAVGYLRERYADFAQ